MSELLLGEDQMSASFMVAGYCDHCNSIVHLERTSFSGKITSILFCPLCGKQGLILSPDITPDEYWTHLGNAYDMPAELMREIFQTWDTTQYKTFREHVEALRAEALMGIAS